MSSSVPIFGGDDESDGGLTEWARRTAVAWAQSYMRQTIGKVENGTLNLTGTRARKLTIGERPLRAVTSVTVDGVAVPSSDYRWTRQGHLFRDSGWGSEELRVTVVASYGFLFIPRDLAAVIDTASARLIANPVGWKSQMETDDGEHAGSRQLLADTPSGFTLHEQMILRKYRRTSL